MGFNLRRRFMELSLPLLPKTGRLVVGVSGGADSLALIQLLSETLPEARERVVGVHVHHGLRPGAADQDAQAVVSQCARLGMLCLVVQRSVRAEARRRGMALEAAGRLARQECLMAAARFWKSRAVLLAHHQDDQAETLLLNLLRGAGSRGLSGMRPVRPFPHPLAPSGLNLLRPLLPFTKQELKLYLQSLGLRWREDRSNRNPAFVRNRIRHGLLPYLERNFNPAIRALLARSAEMLCSQDELLSAQAEGWRGRLLVSGPNHIWKLSLKPMRNLPWALKMGILSSVWDFLHIPGKTHAQMLRLEQAVMRPAALNLTQGWRLESTREYMVFQVMDPKGSKQVSWLPSKNPLAVFGVKINPICLPKNFKGVSKASDHIVVDADKIKQPLAVGFRKPGDRMQPLGLGGAGKSLKKIMSEMKIPLARRSAWPILRMDQEIIWIYCGPISESVKLDPTSSKALKITILKVADRKTVC